MWLKWHRPEQSGPRFVFISPRAVYWRDFSGSAVLQTGIIIQCRLVASAIAGAKRQAVSRGIRVGYRSDSVLTPGPPGQQIGLNKRSNIKRLESGR